MMDDEELTQDVLDQFDLICTQHQMQNVTVPHQTVDRFSDGGGHQNYSGLAPKSSFPALLSRTSSLDRRKTEKELTNGGECQQLESSAVIERLNKEVASLREELYMKLGELATIKDSANRTNALKSDTIVRLESNLACQREEFQKKLSELNAQLASREADYRLVTTELALVREQLCNAKTSVVQDQCNNFSPMSQMVASMLTSPFWDGTPTGKLHQTAQMTSCSPPHGHLPAPITPVPSKRRPAMDGTWKLDHRDKRDRINSIGLRTTGVAEKSAMQHALPPVSVEVALSDQQEHSDNPRKRRRQTHSPKESPIIQSLVPESDQTAKSTVDMAVETDPLVPTQCNIYPTALLYRSTVLPSDRDASMRCFSEPLDLHTLASSLLSINVTGSQILINRDKENISVLNERDNSLPKRHDAPKHIHDDWLRTDEYLYGLNSLLTRRLDHKTKDRGISDIECDQRKFATIVRRAVDAVPYLLVSIEKSIQESLSALRLNPESSLDQTTFLDKPSTKVSEQFPHPLTVNPSTFCPIESNGISYLGEDPFAGAPASQMVTPLATHPVPLFFDGAHAKPTHAPGQLFLSVPTKLQPTEASGLSQPQSPPRIPTALQQVLEHGIFSLKRVQCLLHSLQSWCLSSSALISRSCELSSTYNSVRVDLRMLTVATSNLVARAMDQLADIVIWHTQRNSLTSETVYGEHLASYHPVTESQLSGMRSCANQNPVLPDTTPFAASLSCYLTRFCDILLNLATLASCCVENTSENQLEKTASSPLISTSPLSRLTETKWSLSFISCMIITIYTSSLDVEKTLTGFMGISAAKSIGTSGHLTSGQSFSLTREILFIQLLRFMVSRGHWNLGHQSGDWWTAWFDSKHSPISSTKSELPVKLEYLRSVFGSGMNCPLLAIVGWIHRIGDQFHSMEVELTEPNSTWNANHLGMPGDTRENSMLQFVQLLHEFSSFVTVLTERNDIVWPDSCPCKAKTYSTLISLATRPLCWLCTLPATVIMNAESMNPDVVHNFWFTRSHYVTAFGQLSRALTSLLWRHGENCFQTYTDSLPSYFFLISGLSNWIQQSKALLRSSPTVPAECSHQDSILRPELVEELYDFDSTPENAAKT